MVEGPEVVGGGEALATITTEEDLELLFSGHET